MPNSAMTGSAARGLETTNPAMVAAGSWRPSRSKMVATTATAPWIMVVLPAWW